MSAKTKKKVSTIQYRYLKTDKLGKAFDLKAVLVDVLGRASDHAEGVKLGSQARLRRISLDQEGDVTLLNKITPEKNWHQPFFCGQLIQLAPGTQLPGLMGDQAEDTNEFVLENLNLGEGSEIARGVMYFAVCGQHLALIEGQAVRGRVLERFLTSFLQRAGELEEHQSIVLPRAIPETKDARVRNVQKIDFTGLKTASDGDGEAEEDVGSYRDRNEEKLLQMLEIMCSDRSLVDKVIQKIPEGGYLEGLFSLRIRGAKRRKATLAHQDVEELVRNADIDEVRLEGDGKSRNGEFFLTRAVRLTDVGGGLIDPEEAMKAIVGALVQWSADGKIDLQLEEKP